MCVLPMLTVCFTDVINLILNYPEFSESKIEDISLLEFNFKDNNFLRLPVICSKEKKKWINKIRSCGIWASDEIYQSTCTINSENVNSFKNYAIIKDQLILVSIHPLINEKNLDKLTRIN